MAYNPAEFNNSYDDVTLDAEKTRQERLASQTSTPRFSAEERLWVKDKLVECLRSGASVTTAMGVINGTGGRLPGPTSRVGRVTLYMWRREDEEFRRQWDEAYAEGTDKIEQKVVDLALEGNPTLLQFSLRTRNPSRYAVNRQEVTGLNGGPVQTETSIDLSNLDPAERDALRAILERRTGTSVEPSII